MLVWSGLVWVKSVGMRFGVVFLLGLYGFIISIFQKVKVTVPIRAICFGGISQIVEMESTHT